MVFALKCVYGFKWLCIRVQRDPTNLTVDGHVAGILETARFFVLPAACHDADRESSVVDA